MSESKKNAASSHQFRIWGCRGGISIAGPGHQFYGGMTTCFELETPEVRIVVDAGSGFAALGRAWKWDDKPLLLLFTHLHWDHIVGFPHFAPLYAKPDAVPVWSVRREGFTAIERLAELNRPPEFPVVVVDTMQAELVDVAIPERGQDTFGDVSIRWTDVAHPGGCTAYSFEVGGTRVVFSGDIELPKTDRDAIESFCDSADLLIVDGQYTEAEYERHVGWGHSTNLQAAKLAADADAGKLLLTHHSPAHTDPEIEAMVSEARTIFPATDAAHDGQVIDLLPEISSE